MSMETLLPELTRIKGELMKRSPVDAAILGNTIGLLNEGRAFVTAAGMVDEDTRTLINKQNKEV